MPANFASLEAMAPELRQAIHRLEAAASLMYEDIDARGKKVWRYPDAIVGWMNQIAREITPIIRRFIIQNYIGSGLAKNTNSRYQHTGKLASALQRIIIIPKLRTIRRRNDANIESITFHVRMPPNIPPYEYTPKTQRGQQRRSDFYKVAAALNYGAVRMPNIWRETIDLPTGRRGWVYAPMVGGSAKRTLKQYAITGRASKRALKRIETGTESRQWGGKIIGG
ncbi:MAG: hypothetical protein N3A66_08535, partial [Planctomycetota bacterium]|nr:hypothetical protein [Planctomycetota bacterium]